MSFATTTVLVRARKSHPCCWCLDPIPAGTIHPTWSGFDDESWSWFRARAHRGCKELVDAGALADRTYEGLSQEDVPAHLGDDLGETESREEIDRIVTDPEERARLLRMAADWRAGRIA